MTYRENEIFFPTSQTVNQADARLLHDSGFTLVELLVVMIILGVLATMALPVYSSIKDRAREVRAMEEIRGLEKQIDAYSIDNGGNYPVTANLDFIGRGGALDPWGHPYVYRKVASSDDLARFYLGQLNNDFDLYSKGSDGQTNLDINLAQDDILRAGEGGFVGLASKIIILPM